MRKRSTTGSRAARRLGFPAALIAAGLLASPSAAFAHGNLAMGDFYTGLLQPVFHLNSLLPIVAVALWATQLGDRQAWRLPVVFMGAALAGGAVCAIGLTVPAASWVPYVAMLVVGFLVATRLELPAPAVLSLGLVVGLVHGYSAFVSERDVIQRPVLHLLGACAGIGLLCFHLESLVLRFPAFWMQIAVRVLGSWIAAIGLLVAVLNATAARGAGS